MEKTPQQIANEMLETMSKKDARKVVENSIDDLRKSKPNSLRMVEVATQIEFLNKVKELL
jgi:hypothetical protein